MLQCKDLDMLETAWHMHKLDITMNGMYGTQQPSCLHSGLLTSSGVLAQPPAISCLHLLSPIIAYSCRAITNCTQPRWTLGTSALSIHTPCVAILLLLEGTWEMPTFSQACACCAAGVHQAAA